MFREDRLLVIAFRRSAAVAVLTSLTLASCGGGGGSSTPHVNPTPTPPPGQFNQADYTCPTSDTSSAVARSSASTARGARSGIDAVRRGLARPSKTSQASPNLIAVSYSRTIASSSAAAIASRESAVGGTLTRTLDFPHTGVTIHVLAVAPGKATSTMAALRTQTGVKSVGLTGYRHALTSQQYFQSDPYFNGFNLTQIQSTGDTTDPATFHVGPYEELYGVPGQWDMHAMKLEWAFGYSQNGNTIPATPAALGVSSVKIAMIDTGQDTTHPELLGKVVRQECFISNPNGTQSTSAFTTDPDGHGTNTAGIAGENTNNGLGFAGAGGNISLMGYRVFPTPDDNCTPGNPAGDTDDQCSATTPDIASALEDAVNNGANVISMSFGGGYCSGGVDPDSVEGAAISEAVAAHVVVVASAGNDGNGTPPEAPACDTGVIAVGASALDDGMPNGSGAGGPGTPSAPREYVASYSNSGSPAKLPLGANAWGIVAPGGDASSGNDMDDLHWIENIWTSAPFEATPGDPSFEGECTDDYPNSGGTTPPLDCRTLIEGTSMAAPHVAGAAALILSVNAGAYQSSSAMKTLLCTTADDISDANEGCGRLNIYRAMAYALNDPNKP
jgi:subtilisin family serine protease